MLNGFSLKRFSLNGFFLAAGLLAMLAAPAATASAASFATMSPHLTTIRIEPTRPGGLPGEARETSPFWRPDLDATPTTKPHLTRKPKRR